MRLHAIVPILAAACTSSAPEPTPALGVRRYMFVDDEVLPTSIADVVAAGSDLDGDTKVDNALGDALAALVEQRDARDDASIRRTIASGQVPSTIEIFDANGTEPGAIVGIRYSTRGDAPAPVVRGRATDDGGFAAVALQAGPMPLVVPAVVDAAPVPIVLEYAQLELAPDGSDGYAVRVQGLADAGQVAQAACTALIQMIAADPQDHVQLIGLLDGDGDGTVSPAECPNSPLARTLFAADVRGPDDRPYLSFGIALHAQVPRNVPAIE
jgi:hypothetical protein